ncbi:hypothetical protein V3C99_017205 [Haemonchus contortus]
MHGDAQRPEREAGGLPKKKGAVMGFAPWDAVAVAELDDRMSADSRSRSPSSSSCDRHDNNSYSIVQND